MEEVSHYRMLLYLVRSWQGWINLARLGIFSKFYSSSNWTDVVNLEGLSIIRLRNYRNVKYHTIQTLSY